MKYPEIAIPLIFIMILLLPVSYKMLYEKEPVIIEQPKETNTERKLILDTIYPLLLEIRENQTQEVKTHTIVKEVTKQESYQFPRKPAPRNPRSGEVN